MLHSPKDFERLVVRDVPIDTEAVSAARARQLELTKPPGSLGRLEEIAVWIAGWQGVATPRIREPHIIVFAGNHGVAEQGVSSFPSEVTAQMVANFEAGGAAINQLAGQFGLLFCVLALSLDKPTEDFTFAPAMSEDDCLAALNAGIDAVPEHADLLILGEMGIANSTSAAALAAAVFGGGGSDWAGPGTGLSSAGVSRKAGVIDSALALHRSQATSAFECLRRLGGRELAAIAGAVAKARSRRIPVILDGFIATAAAAPLTLSNAKALDHCLAGHVSAEPGHSRLLRELDKDPLLDLGMRLGEGTGAAIAASIVMAAVATHSGMATFSQAGVAGKAG